MPTFAASALPGERAPAYVAPGGKVNTPFFVFVPQVDQKTAANGK